MTCPWWFHPLCGKFDIDRVFSTSLYDQVWSSLRHWLQFRLCTVLMWCCSGWLPCWPPGDIFSNLHKEVGKTVRATCVSDFSWHCISLCSLSNACLYCKDIEGFLMHTDVYDDMHVTMHLRSRVGSYYDFWAMGPGILWLSHCVVWSCLVRQVGSHRNCVYTYKSMYFSLWMLWSALGGDRWLKQHVCSDFFVNLLCSWHVHAICWLDLFCCDHCPGSCGGLLCQAVVKVLEDLTEQNKVREKVYGKQKVYMVCQVMAMHFMFLAIAVVCMIV